MSDLKLCPKCGGIPVKVHTDDDRWQIICWWNMSCCHHTGLYLSEQQAKDAWNEDNHQPLAEYHLPAEDDEFNKRFQTVASLVPHS